MPACPLSCRPSLSILQQRMQRCCEEKSARRFFPRPMRLEAGSSPPFQLCKKPWHQSENVPDCSALIGRCDFIFTLRHPHPFAFPRWERALDEARHALGLDACNACAAGCPAAARTGLHLLSRWPRPPPPTVPSGWEFSLSLPPQLLFTFPLIPLLFATRLRDVVTRQSLHCFGPSPPRPSSLSSLHQLHRIPAAYQPAATTRHSPVLHVAPTARKA